MTIPQRAFVLLLTTSIACGEGLATTTVHEDGAACLASTDEVHVYDLIESSTHDTTGSIDTLEADAPAAVLVVFETCVSSSIVDESASCEVVLDGTTLSVTGEASYSEPETLNSDCNLLSAWCDTPALPAGHYTLSYGGRSVAVTIPSSGPMPCTDTIYL